MSAETSHSSCLPTVCPNIDFISCFRFKKLLHFFQEYGWSPWSFSHFLNKKFHFLKSVVLRGILNFPGVRKLTSVPHNSVLPGCHHSEVTPFTTSLNDIVPLRFTLQPIPHPAKATAAQEQHNSGLLDFAHPSANQGLVLTAAVVSTYHSPSPFTDDLLPSNTRGRRQRQQPHSHSTYHGNVVRKQRRSEQPLSFQSRILSIS